MGKYDFVYNFLTDLLFLFELNGLIFIKGENPSFIINKELLRYFNFELLFFETDVQFLPFLIYFLLFTLVR